VTGPGHQVADAPHAEDPYVDERLVIAPVAGVFHPLVIDVAHDDPLRIVDGDEIGIVVQSGEKYPVSSRFTGLLVGMLVLPGERVRIHQPVAWLRPEPLGCGQESDSSSSPRASVSCRLAE
jgi:biotin carboxyl carrier protein